MHAVSSVVRFLPAAFLFPDHESSASAAARGHILLEMRVSSTCSDQSGAVTPITRLASSAVRPLVKS